MYEVARSLSRRVLGVAMLLEAGVLAIGTTEDFIQDSQTPDSMVFVDEFRELTDRDSSLLFNNHEFMAGMTTNAVAVVALGRCGVWLLGNRRQ